MEGERSEEELEWQVTVARHKMNVTMKEKLEILNFASKFGRWGSFNPAVKLLLQQLPSDHLNGERWTSTPKHFSLSLHNSPVLKLSSRSSRCCPHTLKPVAPGAESPAVPCSALPCRAEPWGRGGGRGRPGRAARAGSGAGVRGGRRSGPGAGGDSDSRSAAGPARDAAGVRRRDRCPRRAVPSRPGR